MTIERAALRAVTDVEAAARLLRELGYTAPPQALDSAALGLGAYPTNRLLRSGQRRREGYAVWILEAEDLPHALAAWGRQLCGSLHDHPLAVIGMPGPTGAWTRLVIMRPQAVQASGRPAYRMAKIDIQVGSPTRHDAEVVERLRWNSSAADPQAQVEAAFDVEAVTQRFFTGLRAHFDAIEDAIVTAARPRPSVYAGVEAAGGPRRVGIRIMSQVLFCWFLQRAGWLDGDPDYLLTRWRRHQDAYYAAELEPLFYDTLAVPVAERRPDRPGAGVPFLNGGLFARAYGSTSLPLPDGLWSEDGGLLGYLTQWTFTVSEDTPDTVDVAVDPQLLGRIFEHLITDEEQEKHGVVYTPRPVVHFMVREALGLHVGQRLGLPEAWWRRIATDDTALDAYAHEYGAPAALALAGRLDEAAAQVRVLDPAVGSGAFLLGMLSELVRLRSLAHVTRTGQPPAPTAIATWKRDALAQALFGVDIEPLALELCRLRLWLALLQDWPSGTAPPPLPNLEHRTVAADSLTDFVGGVRLQDTRIGERQTHWSFAAVDTVEPLRRQYFATSDPAAKAALKVALAEAESPVVSDWLDQVDREVANRPAAVAAADRAHLAALRQQFLSPDRVFPIFVPAFHAPDVWGAGGWDIVILNPPYLGAKQVAEKVRKGQIAAARDADWVAHHGERQDLLVLFAARARELVRPGGVCALIVQDSVLTSREAESLRHAVTDDDTIRVLARTRCFEGQAVNGAVLIWQRAAPPVASAVRWIEGYQRDPRDFAAASDAVAADAAAPAAAGAMEVWVVPRHLYTRLPHRPWFRPHPAACAQLATFAVLEPPEVRRPDGWRRLSDTRWLRRDRQNRRDTGWYARLTPGQWVPLGYCIDGGVGLQTGDDRRFLAAVEGTPEAVAAHHQQEQVIRTLTARPEWEARWRAARADAPSDQAALERLFPTLAEDPRVPWGRCWRVVLPDAVRTTPLTEAERQRGILSGPAFVPFEKGDQSDRSDGGRRGGARWWRQNPIAIDWSESAVTLLRARARGADPHKKPRIQNEELWGQGGVTWNSLARYLRARQVPEGAIFGHKAPTIRPTVNWLDAFALLALLNSDVAEFIVRTFLGSLMQIEIGDVRRLPVPVLTPAQGAGLSALGHAAVAAAARQDRAAVAAIERDVNGTVRALYGLAPEETLWVVR
jgi:hypothetical protein